VGSNLVAPAQSLCAERTAVMITVHLDLEQNLLKLVQMHVVLKQTKVNVRSIFAPLALLMKKS
jgi:hypothetical protein